MRPRVSTLWLISPLVLVLTAGLLGRGLLHAQSPSAAPSNHPSLETRVITVIGMGEVQAPPDSAMVELGVRTEAATASAALHDNNAKMAALLAKLKELGIAEQDIQTSHISIEPQYDEQGRTIVGYRASNLIRVTIRNINQAGQLLEQVLDAGANTVMGIRFFSAKPAALEQAARERALVDARTKAAALAKASGAQLGQLLQISENLGTPPLEIAAGQGAGGVPIQPGQQTIQALVQVTFELK